MLKLPDFFQHRAEPDLVAVVDLGSNSFHLLVAKVVDGQIIVVDRLREMVRLGAGLDANKVLSKESQQRALSCLAKFGQRLRDLPVHGVRIVGTNTLRNAVNATEFLNAAEALLGHPVDIISGREEARLIYLGVANSMPNFQGKRLVIDIGGGSTEFIIGEGFESLCRESLDMGCVSISRRYFADGVIKNKNLRRAEIGALLELQPVEEMFRRTGWDLVIGTSGTIRAIERVIVEMGWGMHLTADSLQRLRESLLEAGHVDNLNLKGLSVERAPVFAGGVAILSGIFEGLKIETAQVSEGALREGSIYDLLGRIHDEDVRERTILRLSQRYAVDTQQAQRVEETVLECLSQVARAWNIADEEYAQMLSWAARLHEIGLSISHEQYHKHGEYLLVYSDLAGFTRPEQAQLAALVRAHRRKLPQDVAQRCPHLPSHTLLRLCVLLRIAVLLHRSRSTVALPKIELSASDNALKITFPDQWLEQHPLTLADLEQERDYLQAIKWSLIFE